MSRPLFDMLEELAPRVAEAAHLLLFLDFDGTLTPIAPHPDMVRLEPSRIAALRELSRHSMVSMTLISGRERNNLQARVGVPGVIYAGNHGLEISGPGFVYV